MLFHYINNSKVEDDIHYMNKMMQFIREAINGDCLDQAQNKWFLS